MGIVDVFKKRAIGRIPMKVCMMGPRAVGKTTILTAVFTDTQENIGSTTNLLLQAQGDTSSELTNRKRQLLAIFREHAQITDRPAAGLSASSTINTFDFLFGLKGKEPRIELEIKDFPGEYIQKKPDNVQQFIRESTAVFVAIDTPHLMEENGAFCIAKNRPDIITDFFLNNLKEFKDEKLVLFVPLKCERYFSDNCMNEVLDRVETVYSELIRAFKDSNKIACAITPIMTLGEVEFSHITKKNNVIPINMVGCPEEVVYRFKSSSPHYKPAFCVQPLYYMLSFLASKYGRDKNKRGVIDRIFSSIYNLFDSDEPLFDEILKMEKYRKVNLPGYKIVCGSELFHYCK